MSKSRSLPKNPVSCFNEHFCLRLSDVVYVNNTLKANFFRLHLDVINSVPIYTSQSYDDCMRHLRKHYVEHFCQPFSFHFENHTYILESLYFTGSSYITLCFSVLNVETR